MKFAIIGAGAIGGYVGAYLARAGEEVVLVARGPQLRAIQAGGIRVRLQTEEFSARPRAVEDPAEIGPVDAVLLTVKAHSLAPIAPRLAPLIGADTPVVTAQNGIPWWYFERHGGRHEGTRLESVDPGGILARTIPARNVVGCVVYCSTIVAEPGVIEHIEGNRFSIGELDGARTERCQRIADALQKAGLKCPIRTRIRHDIWVKLLGNLAFNPISALTRATLDRILEEPDTRALARAMMEEGEAVARALGVELDISIDRRMEGAARVGVHKTSMLQDVEAGRPLELESIAGAVVELAGILGIPVPHTRAVYACTKLLAKWSCSHVR
jgi:2-dehydropantoate 2-reductase